MSPDQAILAHQSSDTLTARVLAEPGQLRVHTRSTVGAPGAHVDLRAQHGEVLAAHRVPGRAPVAPGAGNPTGTAHSLH